MEKFTASNGIGIRIDEHGDLDFHTKLGWSALCAGKIVDALREFFQHERDAELGRWRDPFEPHYVCYPVDGGKTVYVVDERNGMQKWLNRRVTAGDDGPHGAAFRFFEAHPERKPWEDAKPGEVWELTIDDGSVHTVFVHEDRTMGGRDGVSAGGAYFDIDDADHITAGRRVWPEDAS